MTLQGRSRLERAHIGRDDGHDEGEDRGGSFHDPHRDRPGGHGGALPSLLSGAVLLVWAAVFWALVITGSWSQFLAARVAWIAPIAAVLLTLAGAGALWADRGERLPTFGGRTLLQLGCLMLPAALVLGVPLSALSSFAAERRNSFAGAQAWAATELGSADEVSFQHLVAAQESTDMLAVLQERRGEPVELLGVITERGSGAFTLTRFVVACCVVDASVVSLEIRTDDDPGDLNDWVSVVGALDFDETGVPVLTDAEVAPAEQPNPPYLYPGS